MNTTSVDRFEPGQSGALTTRLLRRVVIGNESVPKIVINNTINFFFYTAIGILPILNRNSFRVLFDKIASVYFI